VESAYIEQQQCELIACLEQSFQELLASNAALCARFNRLEQLVLQHRSIFAHQAAEQQHISTSAVAGSQFPDCVRFGSRDQACRFIGDFAAADEMLSKPVSSTMWRNGNQPDTRMSQAEKNVFGIDGSTMSETDDVSSSSAVNSEHRDHWQNVAVSSDVDAIAGPQRTSADTRC